MKVGDIKTFTYENAPVPKEQQYKPGQRVDVFDKNTRLKIAVYEVLETTDTEIEGKIINTFGHKQGRKRT